MSKPVKLLYVVQVEGPEGRRTDLVYASKVEIERIEKALLDTYGGDDVEKWSVINADLVSLDFETYRTSLGRELGIHIPGTGPKDWLP